MNPDDERELHGAFAELHRRQREEAPPFGAMRERALRRAGEPHRRPSPARWLAATACLVVAAVAWRTGAPAPAPRVASSTPSPQRVEQLLDSIERQLELRHAIDAPDFLTDFLLTQTSQPSTP